MFKDAKTGRKAALTCWPQQGEPEFPVAMKARAPVPCHGMPLRADLKTVQHANLSDIAQKLR